jgi:hypothetical protein
VLERQGSWSRVGISGVNPLEGWIFSTYLKDTSAPAALVAPVPVIAPPPSRPVHAAMEKTAPPARAVAEPSPPPPVEAVTPAAPAAAPATAPATTSEPQQ